VVRPAQTQVGMKCLTDCAPPAFHFLHFVRAVRKEQHWRKNEKA